MRGSTDAGFTRHALAARFGDRSEGRFLLRVPWLIDHCGRWGYEEASPGFLCLAIGGKRVTLTSEVAWLHPRSVKVSK